MPNYQVITLKEATRALHEIPLADLAQPQNTATTKPSRKHTRRRPIWKWWM